MPKTFQERVDDFARFNEFWAQLDDAQRETTHRVLKLWFEAGGNVSDLEHFEADIKHNIANAGEDEPESPEMAALGVLERRVNEMEEGEVQDGLLACLCELEDFCRDI